ncbi:DUF2059 domain-containing protein [Chelatococcus sp. SYSU_G07232]|uniref:DUF2059 domain-containing protein n=1 Tax=Chelatococcus albus TaxID=3047466 RepID=A0ABT7AKD2_9HYPH|nr:DUF2059 domain-containing protein [Chelatococcus sp. SYSU_G07232]MDJ1159831.1 DUF2059 domain-containing protein [Chelatococcus sp. SYSU_G07232]
MNRFLTRVAAASLVLALAGGAASAQTATATAPSHLQAAREVVLASGMSRSFDAMLPTFGDQVRQIYVTRPEIAADLNAVLDQLKPELEKQKDEMVTTAARVLAGRMNEAELKEVGAFFKSPAGQRYVSTQPQVLDELFNEMRDWVQKTSEFVITRVRAEMKKKGHEL